jgi:hypothetical protein
MSGYTHEQLAALKAAAAKGLRTVSYDGRSVTFDSLKELRAQIAVMERDLNPGRARVHYPTFERGT